MRILYVTTVGSTMRFFINHINALINDGHSVDIACNCQIKDVPDEYRKLGCTIYGIDCSRRPIDRGNLAAVRQIKRIVLNGNYDFIHCHTPIAAACTRLACAPYRRNGLKVVYTAHGFHFYSGAPFMNWALYFPIEWACSWVTDALITITSEDYERALRHLHSLRTYLVPGVGIETNRFTRGDGERVREELGLLEGDHLLLSVGELNNNKNHLSIVRALPHLSSNIHYAVAGVGGNEKLLKETAKELGVAARFHLLGYRSDIPDLLSASDVYVLPSLREGLNVSLMEAMACGLPCVCRSMRGNTDLVEEGLGGALVASDTTNAWLDAIRKALGMNRDDVRLFNQRRAEQYSFRNVESSLSKVLGELQSPVGTARN